MPEPTHGLAQRGPGRRRAQHRAGDRSGAQRLGQDPGRHDLGDVAIHGSRELRGLGGLGEEVEHVDGALRLGVDQVEGLAVAVRQVGQVVHRLGHEVDRDHVGVAEVDAHQRRPRGERVAQRLEHREEVVGPVDLVHLAGLGVPDHHRGPVDPEGHRRLLAHDLLRLELRAVVRRGQALVDVEHRLVPEAVVVTGRGDGGHLVEAAGVEVGGELEGVAGAADVEALVLLVGGGHVVDRGQVEEVVDRALVLLDPGGVDPEGRLLEVPGDQVHPPGMPPALDQALHAPGRAGSGQDEHLALAVVQELLDEESPDEPGGASDEVGHGRSPAVEVSPQDSGDAAGRHPAETMRDGGPVRPSQTPANVAGRAVTEAQSPERPRSRT